MADIKIQLSKNKKQEESKKNEIKLCYDCGSNKHLKKECARFGIIQPRLGRSRSKSKGRKVTFEGKKQNKIFKAIQKEVKAVDKLAKTVIAKSYPSQESIDPYGLELHALHQFQTLMDNRTKAERGIAIGALKTGIFEFQMIVPWSVTTGNTVTIGIIPGAMLQGVNMVSKSASSATIVNPWVGTPTSYSSPIYGNTMISNSVGRWLRCIAEVVHTTAALNMGGSTRSVMNTKMTTNCLTPFAADVTAGDVVWTDVGFATSIYKSNIANGPTGSVSIALKSDDENQFGWGGAGSGIAFAIDAPSSDQRGYVKITCAFEAVPSTAGAVIIDSAFTKADPACVHKLTNMIRDNLYLVCTDAKTYYGAASALEIKTAFAGSVHHSVGYSNPLGEEGEELIGRGEEAGEELGGNGIQMAVNAALLRGRERGLTHYEQVRAFSDLLNAAGRRRGG